MATPVIKMGSVGHFPPGDSTSDIYPQNLDTVDASALLTTYCNNFILTTPMQASTWDILSFTANSWVSNSMKVTM